MGIELSGAHTGSIAMTAAHAWQRHITLDPQAVSILESFNRDKIAGLTTNFVYEILSKFELTALFRRIVIPGEVGVNKPDPKVFSMALAGTGLRESEVVLSADLLGALAAGITPVLIGRVKNRAETGVSAHHNDDAERPDFSALIVENDVRVIRELMELTALF